MHAKNHINKILINFFNEYEYAFTFAIVFLLASLLYMVIFKLYTYPLVSQSIYWKESFNAFKLITSPFSPLEDISPYITFSQIEVNLLNNFLYVFLVIASLEAYYNWLKKKNDIKIIFYFCIAASYLTAIFWWIYKGTPSTGTSIIGLVFTLTILWVLITNAKKVWNKIKELFSKANKESNKFLICAYCLLFGYLFAYVIMISGLIGYVLNSNNKSLSISLPIHLTGLIFFLILLFINDKLSKRND